MPPVHQLIANFVVWCSPANAAPQLCRLAEVRWISLDWIKTVKLWNQNSELSSAKILRKAEAQGDEGYSIFYMDSTQWVIRAALLL